MSQENSLSNEACEVCRVGAPTLTEEELTALQPQIPDWTVEEVEGERQFVRQFTFKNYSAGLSFTNQVAELAEQHNHHPSIKLEWGKVEVRWWTHKIGGVHRTDAIMAAKTDAFYG